MQYILTKKEYDSIITKEVEATEKANKKLQEVCCIAAERIPIMRDYRVQDRVELMPLGCLLVGDKEDFYCDDCVVNKFCPYENKSWSK